MFLWPCTSLCWRKIAASVYQWFKAFGSWCVILLKKGSSYAEKAKPPRTNGEGHALVQRILICKNFAPNGVLSQTEFFRSERKGMTFATCALTSSGISRCSRRAPQDSSNCMEDHTNEGVEQPRDFCYKISWYNSLLQSSTPLAIAMSLTQGLLWRQRGFLGNKGFFAKLLIHNTWNDRCKHLQVGESHAGSL